MSSSNIRIEVVTRSFRKNLFKVRGLGSQSRRVHQYRREAKATQELVEQVISLSIEYGFPLRIAAGTFMRGWALTEQEQREEGMNNDSTDQDSL